MYVCVCMYVSVVSLLVMYSHARAGEHARNWVEPRGLKPGVGLTAEIAQKFIMHSIKAVNKHIEGSRYIRHMGPVGSWSQRDIDALVLPTAGDMVGDEHQEMNNEVAENVIREAIIVEVNNP